LEIQQKINITFAGRRFSIIFDEMFKNLDNIDEKFKLLDLNNDKYFYRVSPKTIFFTKDIFIQSETGLHKNKKSHELTERTLSTRKVRFLF